MPRILLDQNIPRDLGDLLPGHDVEVALEMGWDRLTNGELLAAAERAGFAAIVTADRGMRYQQNLAGRQIAPIVLSTNHWPTLRVGAGRISQALQASAAGSYLEVGLPRPRLRRAAASQSGTR